MKIYTTSHDPKTYNQKLYRNCTLEEEAYYNAWYKVRAWVSFTFRDIKHDQIEIKFISDYDHWVYLCVSEKNEAFIVSGSHGSALYGSGKQGNKFVEAPTSYREKQEPNATHAYKKGEQLYLSDTTLGMMKEVVNNWQDLKKRLIEERNRLENLFNFVA